MNGSLFLQVSLISEICIPEVKFCQENALVIANTNNTREDVTHGHRQMVNTEIRLIIFFAAKDGEALYSHKNKTKC